jgi:hypothetical protein
MIVMRSGNNWRRLLRREAHTNHPAVQITHLEPDPVNEPQGSDGGKEVDQRCRIHIHSRRRRLTDPDGISSKACIDGIREGGLLQDDSAEFVREVTFSQEKSEVEETIIDLVWD